MTDRDVFILSAVRSPIGLGKPSGALFPFLPVNLSALVLVEALRRAGIDPAQVEDVIWGIVTPIGDQGANLARLAVLKAGFPVTVPGVTINRMCGSSQQAVHFASQAILSGDMDIIIAGGIEMMSHQAMGADFPKTWPEDFPYDLVRQGISSELMAEKWNLSREALDAYASQSHIRAGSAIRNGYFHDQILPVELPDGTIFSQDQGVRSSLDREKMAALKPVFKKNGVVTAGNASQISDGTAALVLASSEAVGRYNLMPMARVVSRVAVGSDPILMLDGPIAASQKVLKKSGLTLEDMGVIELNEAFASVALAWAKEMKPDLEKFNPNGGAIAHGHPLGATGAILLTKLVYELERRKARYGLQSMCIGHGMATATILERV
ncbi:MAG: thiolase family protein [Anaerolineales bacterium]|nr:thiolase family protein [Anaerolineales bacterium]